MQLWVRETEFILALLFLNYCIIFHMNNCKPLPHPVCTQENLKFMFIQEICTRMFTAALLRIAKNQNVHQLMKNKQNVLCPPNRLFSHIRILMHATTSINLENIMLSERSQTPKATYFVIQFFFWNIQNRHIHKRQNKLMVAWGWGKGRMELTANGYEVFFWGGVVKILWN